jgi:hypothetical protein
MKKMQYWPCVSTPTMCCAPSGTQLLADYPALATSTEEWRTKPGWYWRLLNVSGEVYDEGGPCLSDGQCRVEAERRLEAATPEDVAAMFEDLLDEGETT